MFKFFNGESDKGRVGGMSNNKTQNFDSSQSLHILLDGNLPKPDYHFQFASTNKITSGLDTRRLII